MNLGNLALTQTESDAMLFEQLRLQGMKVKPKDAWMKSFGRAQSDPHFEQAMKFGAEWRKEENLRSLNELNK